MNLEFIHTICRMVRKDVTSDFKAKINNPIFPLTTSIIDTEIEDMRQSYYQKVYKKVYNNFNISKEQHKVLDTIAGYYIKPAIVRGTDYAQGFLKK